MAAQVIGRLATMTGLCFLLCFSCTASTHRSKGQDVRPSPETSHRVDGTWVGVLVGKNRKVSTMRLVLLGVQTYWEVPCVELVPGAWIAEFVRDPSTEFSGVRIAVRTIGEAEVWHTYETALNTEQFISLDSLERDGAKARERIPGRGLHQYFWVVVREDSLAGLQDKSVALMEYRPVENWLPGSTVGWMEMTRMDSDAWVFCGLRVGEFTEVEVSAFLRATVVDKAGEESLVDLGEQVLVLSRSAWRFY